MSSIIVKQAEQGQDPLSAEAAITLPGTLDT